MDSSFGCNRGQPPSANRARLLLVRPAQPGILPCRRHILIIPAETNIYAIAITDFYRLVFADRDEAVPPMREPVCLVARFRIPL